MPIWIPITLFMLSFEIAEAAKDTITENIYGEEL